MSAFYGITFMLFEIMQTFLLCFYWSKSLEFQVASLNMTKVRDELDAIDRKKYMTAEQAYNKGYKAGRQSLGMVDQ